MSVTENVSLLLSRPTVPPLIIVNRRRRLCHLILGIIDGTLRRAPTGNGIVVHLETLSGRTLVAMRSAKINVRPSSRPQVFSHFCHVRGSQSHRDNKTNLKLSVTLTVTRTRNNDVRIGDTVSGNDAFAVGLPLTDSNAPLNRLHPSRRRHIGHRGRDQGTRR